MKLGRPVEPVPQHIAEDLVHWIASGKTLRSFCRQEQMPAYSSVYEWIRKDPDFSARIARARESGYDAIADECVEIIDSAVDANLAKAQVWTRLQLLAKWDPKRYGERTILSGDADNPIMLSTVLAEARKRIADTSGDE